jgi:hypothetical protein
MRDGQIRVCMVDDFRIFQNFNEDKHKHKNNKEHVHYRKNYKKVIVEICV